MRWNRNHQVNHNTFAGWWFSDIFYYHPKNWGRWTHFDKHMFQRGWNQPPTTVVCHFWSVGIPVAGGKPGAILHPTWMCFHSAQVVRIRSAPKFWGPERWPMQPGVMLVGGFPRVAEREAALVATFEGSCCSKQVELLPVKTKYPHEKWWLEDETSYWNGPVSGDINIQGFFWRASRCPKWLSGRSARFGPSCGQIVDSNLNRTEVHRGIFWDFEGEKLKVPCFF